MAVGEPGAWEGGWAFSFASGQNSGNLPIIRSSLYCWKFKFSWFCSYGIKMLPWGFWPLIIAEIVVFKSIIFLSVVILKSILWFATCINRMRLSNLKNCNRISLASSLNFTYYLFCKYRSASRVVVRSERVFIFSRTVISWFLREKRGEFSEKKSLAACSKPRLIMVRYKTVKTGKRTYYSSSL